MDNERADINMEHIEKERDKKLRGRKKRWLILSILFALIALRVLFDHHYLCFDLSFLYSLPALIPVTVCLIMYIAVRKYDTFSTKKVCTIYRATTIFAAILIAAGLILMLFSTTIIAFNHTDETSDIQDYTRARIAVKHPSRDAGFLPQRITDDMQNVRFEYFDRFDRQHLYLTYNISGEALEKEISRIEGNSPDIYTPHREILLAHLKNYSPISDIDEHNSAFSSNAKFYIFDYIHDFRNSEEADLANVPYISSGYICGAIIDNISPNMAKIAYFYIYW